MRVVFLQHHRKNRSLAMNLKKKSNKKQVERPKTRKELRKEKRLQKKSNRVFFHKRKKELKIEYRNRLKQKNKQQQSTNKPTETEPTHEDDDSEAEASFVDNDGDDEEIASDFELSDEEVEQKFQEHKVAKRKVTMEPTPIEQERQKDKQKQRRYEKEMQKQRIRQLKSANDDEDKIIRKLEKQLKIDKKRSEKNVPKMFDDGLDYALELCLPENIQKMYTAAKEAAETDSDDGFEEDLYTATTGQSGKRKSSVIDELPSKKSKAMDRKMGKLREVESKYFGKDDVLDSDLSGVDSEFEGYSEEESDGDALADNTSEDEDDAPAELKIGRNKNQKLTKPKTVECGKFVKADKPALQDDDGSDSEGGFSDSGSNLDSSSIEDDNLKEDNDAPWEDIYGRKRSKDGEVLPVCLVAKSSLKI